MNPSVLLVSGTLQTQCYRHLLGHLFYDVGAGIQTSVLRIGKHVLLHTEPSLQLQDLELPVWCYCKISLHSVVTALYVLNLVVLEGNRQYSILSQCSYPHMSKQSIVYSVLYCLPVIFRRAYELGEFLFMKILIYNDLIEYNPLINWRPFLPVKCDDEGLERWLRG